MAYIGRTEGFLAFVLTKYHVNDLTFIFHLWKACPNHICVHATNGRKPATKTGMQRAIALAEVQTFHRCLIVYMGQTSFEMNREYIKCTLSLPHPSCLSDFAEGF